MPNEPINAPSLEQPVRLLPPPVTASQRRHRRKVAAKLGVPVDQVPDRRGRHPNHARASTHARWNEGRMLSDHGYIRIRVGRDHPLADPNGYAYEHLIVWAAAARPLPGPDESIHHVDHDKTNNRIDNLEIKSRSDHAAHHDADRGRDELGRFPRSEVALA